MRINNPTTYINHPISPGNVILQYKGVNEDLYNRKTYRRANLNLIFGEGIKGSSYTLSFYAEIDEFFNIPLRLDFISSEVTKLETSAVIGNLELTKIFCDSKSLVISGNYFHESLTLAYHDNDMILFDCIFDLQTVGDPLFSKKLNNLEAKVPELMKKIVIY